MPVFRLPAVLSSFPVKPLVAACLLGSVSLAQAATYSVTNEAELRAAIQAVNANPGTNFIDLDKDITLAQALPPILGTVTIRGNAHVLAGMGNERLFVVGAAAEENGPRILVQLVNIVLQGGVAQGGDGAGGGGGGLGGGGALLVNSQADVVLHNVSMLDNSAIGGDGAAGTLGGGGGLGGNGAGNSGGGGGLTGNGASNSGGGGGLQGNGGANGGGGGGYTGNGGSAGAGSNGSESVYWSGGTAAGNGSPAGNGGTNGGGGGGGADSGGGGGFGGQGATAGNGGDGALGGGGGGSLSGTGGDGGFGGGGGGGVIAGGQGGYGGGGGGSALTGGDGGFGGGGGSGANVGGDGGFGGGGGAGTAAGQGGTGGGDAVANGGGGGAGLGGSVFVVQGGTLSISGSGIVTNGAATGGAGANGAGNGDGGGSGLFLQGSGTLTLSVTSEQELDIRDSISDSVGLGLLPASSYKVWNLNVRGGGSALIDPTDPAKGVTYGTVILRGNNQYSGDTFVTGANLAIGQSGSLGPGGVISLDDGGLIVDNGMVVTRDIAINNGGRIGVNAGESVLQGDVSGRGALNKVGKGDLRLESNVSISGSWLVSEGNLVIDDDARLGIASNPLLLSGGGIKFDNAAVNLRNTTVLSAGGFLDSNGLDIHLQNSITGLGALRLVGGGRFLLDAVSNIGGTVVTENTDVTGSVGTGSLTVESGSSYTMGNSSETVERVTGGGTFNLTAGNTLTTKFNGTPEGPVTVTLEGLIQGDGALAKAGSASTLVLTNDNTYTGGTVITGSSSIVQISSDKNVGTGAVTLDGGTLALSQATTGINIVLASSGSLYTGNVVWNGLISGGTAASVLSKIGSGTLVLNNANTYSGTTRVFGSGSYVALANAQGLGQSSLRLENGGGLRLLTSTNSLLSIELESGQGVIDTNGFDAVVTQGMTGSGGLDKNGAGTLTLNKNSTYLGATNVKAGRLVVGTGGAEGSIGGGGLSIEDAATVAYNLSSDVTLASIGGLGTFEQNGSGRVLLDGQTSFDGLVFVNNGRLAFNYDGVLGKDDVTVRNNSTLELGGSLLHNVDVDGGARLSVTSGSQTMSGSLSGTGLLEKVDAGTLVFTGVSSMSNIRIQDGTFQLGSGLAGAATGNFDVQPAGTLIFGRDDAAQYDGVISGGGHVVKQGNGQLILTGEQLFSGTFDVQRGDLRIGFGGTSGSFSGTVNLAASTDPADTFTTRLIFDRSDDSVFNGGTSGDGQMLKNGAGKLTVIDDLAHTGGTQINSGVLQIGNGGTTGNVHHSVVTSVGTRLAINRSDNVSIDADISGAGALVQSGTGTTTLTGTNTQTGGVIVEQGHLAINSDALLGASSGKLIIRNGGVLRYLADFNLRDITLEPTGGGLDTNGFDINYTGLISGSGNLVKEGAGRLTVTRLLLEGNLSVMKGELRLGDGMDDTGSAASLGSAFIDTNAELSLNRNGLVNVSGSFSGGGNIHQIGTSELRLPGDSSAFTGTTYIDNGSLRLNGRLGGDVVLAAGTKMQGTGVLLGNLNVGGGVLAPGNSIGTLSLGSLTLSNASRLEMEVDATGGNDRINVTGAAALGGILKVIPLPGNYTAPGCCTYTLISAGSISNTFDTIQSDLVFLEAKVTYLTNEVKLTFGTAQIPNPGGGSKDIEFRDVSRTYNQRQVSSALDAIKTADPDDELVALITTSSSQDKARAAYDALSGDALLSSVDTSSRMARRFNHLLTSRSSRLGLASRGGSSEPAEKSLAAVRAGQIPEAPAAFTQSLDPLHYDGPTSKVEGLWVDANAVKLTQDSDDIVGSAGSSFTGQLLALGVDGYWTDNLIIGFGAGYLQGSMGFDNRQGDGDATGTFIGSYGRWETNSGWHYKAALTLGQQSTDQNRSGNINGTAFKTNASVDVTSATAEFEAGVALHLGNYGLRPYAVLDTQYLKRDAVNETGSNLAALSVDAATDVLGEFGVGVELSRPWLTGGARWAQVVAGVALLQPFGDTQREETVRFSGTSNTFNIKATPDDSAALQLTLGGEWYLSKSVAVWGGYEGRISSNTQEHNGVISFQYRW